MKKDEKFQFGTTHHEPIMSGPVKLPLPPFKKPKFLPLIEFPKEKALPVFEPLTPLPEPYWEPIAVLEDVRPFEPLILSKELQERLLHILENLPKDPFFPQLVPYEEEE